MVIIYRQEILNDISLFTSQPKAKFYDELFLGLDLSMIPSRSNSKGRKGFDNHSLICAFIVMKCEGFTQITDLVDYLNNNLLIAHYCGFDISKNLPSYTKFERFIKNINHDILSTIMQSQVLKACNIGIIDTSFIGLDSTPIHANTSHNNPKSFKKNKFKKSNHPSSDKDCGLGVHTASNQYNNKNFDYYWGYKNHVLVDCITGLPIYDLTTTANIADSSVTVDILEKVNAFISLDECTFIADKGYDVKIIYNTVQCPCNHKNWNNGKKNRGCTKYVTVPDDYRLSIDRDSIAFKSVYALRTECERYNSRFKNTGQERMWVRNQNSVANLNTIAHIALLSIAIAAVVTKKDTTFRSRKKLLRSA